MPEAAADRPHRYVEGSHQLAVQRVFVYDTIVDRQRMSIEERKKVVLWS